MNIALVIIDVQKDFCDGGVLPARDTSTLIAPLNAVIRFCESECIVSVFTRDWHPPNHCSFHEYGGPWPVHCVQNSRGAEFAENLYFPSSSLIIDIEKDREIANMSYSAFENTDLEQKLHRLGVTEIAACGIATDYCVKATVLDACRYGFGVSVLTDISRPINVNPGDDIRALSEMQAKGTRLMTADEWMRDVADSLRK